MQDHGAKIFVSVVLGGFSAALAYVLFVFLTPETAFELAALTGNLLAMAVFPVLVLSEKRVLKKYAEMEKNITSPIVYKANAHFILDRQVRHGNLYFCETGVLMIALYKKTWLVDEVRKQNIETIRFESFLVILQAKDGRVFRMMIPDAGAVEAELKSKNWMESL